MMEDPAANLLFDSADIPGEIIDLMVVNTNTLAAKVARERNTNIITMSDMEKMGVDKTAEMALEIAWDGGDMVYLSFDIDSIDCGFVPGTGWPEPGGVLPRESLAQASEVAAEGICGSRCRRPMTSPRSRP